MSKSASKVLRNERPSDYIGEADKLASRLSYHDSNMATVVKAVNSIDDWTFRTTDIAKNVSISRRTVGRKLKLLEQHGFLQQKLDVETTVWRKHELFDLPQQYERTEVTFES